jgi:D-amino peptidase
VTPPPASDSAGWAASAYVSVDMEGCASLVHWDEVRPSAELAYRRSCELMTDETNAVIDGIAAAGAGRVVVNDSHSTMRNLLPERLRASATLVSGTIKSNYMLEGIDPDFSAAFFVGYHGAIGDQHAAMGHTYSPRSIYECRLNGEPVGELTINAALAGHYGVPVVLVSGDRTTIDEARRRLPWVVGVETKSSISYYAALGPSPANVRRDLETGAREAMRNRNRARPFTLRAPITMELDTQTTAHADVFEFVPGAERRGARTIAYQGDDFAAVYRALVAMLYLGAAVPA